MTIADPLASVASSDPGRPFVVRAGSTLTYAEASRRATFAAERLREEGFIAGERIALHHPEGPRAAGEVEGWLIALIAILRIGGVAVPLSSRLPQDVVLRTVEDSRYAALLGPAGTSVESLVSGELTSIPGPWHAEHPATIVHTSGSVAGAKAALLTLGNHWWSARGWHDVLPLGARDRWLLSLPVYHVSGLAVVMRCIFAGATIAVPDPNLPTHEAARDLGATRMSMVQTQLARALADNSDAPPALQQVLLGGSAIPHELIREVSARGWPVSVSYGLTEMSSTVTMTPPGAVDDVLRTSGAVLPFRDVRLGDDNEIIVRGPTRFSGYVVGGEVETPFQDEGWFATGDIGEWEHHGDQRFLKVLGRKDSRFISGGENISPEAIEAVLHGCPGVRLAVVVPIDDLEFGQRPVAFVDADGWDLATWKTAIASALPRFMIPDHFFPLETPSEATPLKPDRAALARKAELMVTRSE